MKLNNSMPLVNASFLSILFMLVFGLGANATTYTVSGDWLTGTWSPSYPGTTIASGDEVVTVGAVLVSSGLTVTFQAGSTLTSNGQFLVMSNATLHLHGTTNMTGYYFRMLGTGNTVTNYGTFNAAPGITFILGGPGDFINEVGGTINFESNLFPASVASITNKGTFTIPAGASIDINLSGFEFNNMVGGVLENNGTLTVASGVIFTQNGEYTGTGLITIPTFTNGPSGKVSVPPGSPSYQYMTISGNYVQNTEMDVVIGGANDQLHSKMYQNSGIVTLGGTLNVSLANGYAPTTQTTFNFIYAPFTGGSTFSAVNFPNDGNTWEVLYNNPCIECVSVRVTPPSGSTWTGANSTAWNDAGNWNPSGVPAASANAIIPNVANHPVISSAATIADVTLASGATLSVGSGATLTLDGTLDNSGTVTIQSGGSFLQGASSSISGSGIFNVQRQGGSLYNMWSSPVQVQNGVPGTSYEYVSSVSTQDDSDDAEDPGWSAYNGAMTPGKGYAGLGGGLATFTGAPTNGNVNYSLYYTAFDNTYTQTSGGTPFNLVGNPYPSAISAASFLAANPDLDGTIYLWNDNGSNNYSRTDYAYWNGTGGLGTGGGITPNGFIGTGQGFMVRALSGGAVANFTNAQRVAGNNTQFHKPNAEDSRLLLSVEKGSLRDEILIGLLQDATEDEDRMYDAVKLGGNNGFSLSAIHATTEYAILAVPPVIDERMIPLLLETTEAGEYSFVANTMENFEGQNVYFFDSKTGIRKLLTEGQSVNVSLEAGYFTNRFYLNFMPQLETGIEQNELEQFNAWVSSDLLHISFNSEIKNATISLLDMSGKTIVKEQNRMVNGGNVSLSLDGLSSGFYAVFVTTEMGVQTKKIIKN